MAWLAGSLPLCTHKHYLESVRLIFFSVLTVKPKKGRGGGDGIQDARCLICLIIVLLLESAQT